MTLPPKINVLARSFATMLVVGLIAFSGPLAVGEQINSRIEISVDDGRPLAASLDEVEKRFGWTVTYEDPPYQHASEIDDVTSRVRRDGRTQPRVVVPRGGAFSFSYTLPTDAAVAPNAAGLLEALLTRYEASGNPGYFRALADGPTFHVIPTKVLNDAGVVVECSSLLESTIWLERGEMTVLEVVRSITAAVSIQAGTKVIVGAAPLGLLQSRVQVDASKERARTLLGRYLASTGRQISWRLFYDPGMKLYVLNLHPVPAMAGGQ